MHDGKLRSGCTTRQSAADGQTTGPDKREVVSHVRTRSLDRLSPRVRRTDNSRLPSKSRGLVEIIEEHLPRKTRKTVPPKRLDRPLYSPETLDALDKAEKLIREAQKRILEASYDVNSSSERELSDGYRSPRIGKTREDEERLYIRDIVASRFHEANETGRIYTRVSARRPFQRLRRPEVWQTPYRPIVEYSGGICYAGSTTPYHQKMKNKEAAILTRVITEKIEKCVHPDREIHTRQETSKNLSRGIEKSITMWKDRDESETGEDRKTGKICCIQQGPRVDIRNELTTTNLEKINISPGLSTLPVQCNSKTYEFRHETCRDEIIEKAPVVQLSTIRDETEVDEKSRVITGGSEAAEIPSSNRRGSSSDLVENKSGRSIESERFEGRENTRISCHDVRTTKDKLDGQKETFIDFLQRAATNEGPLLFPSENFRRDDSSETRETGNMVDIFDRAVRQFFRDFRRANLDWANCPGEIDSVDAKLPEDRVETSDVSLDNELPDNEGFEDNWDLEDVNLEPLDLGKLDSVLRKFDSTMNEVLRGAKHLSALISEYSMNEADQPKRYSANADLTLPDRDKLCAVSSKNTSVSRASEAIERQRTREDSLINDHSNISTITNIDDSAMSVGVVDGISLPSRRDDIKKDPNKNFTAHPKFSTPLNNDLKIGKSFANNVNHTSNDFSNFCYGFHKSAIDREKKSSSNRDSAKVDKLNQDKPFYPKERGAVLSVGAKNDFESGKKVILGEIEKKCNFHSFFNRNRTGHDKINEIQQTVTFPFCTPRENRDSVARSLVQDTAIDRHSDRYENPSFGAEVNSEHSTKKDSTLNSVVAERDTLSQNHHTGSQNAGFTRTQPLNDKTDVRELGSAKCVETERVAEESTGLVASENIVRTPTIPTTSAVAQPPKSHSEIVHEAKNDSAEEKRSANKTLASSSSASSLKDRTSLDVSTAYSEDFEDSAASANLNKAEKPISSVKDPQLKSISEEPNIRSKDDTETKKSEEAVESRRLSVAVSIKSKAEIDYLEKSISASTVESNERNKGRKLSDDGCKLENGDTRNESMDPNKGEREETNQLEITKNPVPIESSVVDLEIEATKKHSKSSDSRENDKTCELVGEFQIKSNEEKTEDPEIPTTPKSEKSCQSGVSKREEIANFGSTLLIHSTPKKIMKDSTDTSEKLHRANSDPISSGASRAIDTCVENYSEGELYLPSSYSYSLGEIKIAKPGICYTTLRPADLESPPKTADGMKTFVGKIGPINTNEYDSTTPSPGEVQETDMESSCSSSGIEASHQAGTIHS